MLFSQSFEKKAKYLDSIVSKADTIFILFTKEINFVQSEVPIYQFQIEIEKLKEYGKIEFDTLNDGRLIYKNLPGQSSSKYVYDTIRRKKQPLIFEDDDFRKYNQSDSKKNTKIIGYEKRTCLNNDNRISQDFCSGDSFYKYVFYHSYVKPEYQKKYRDYIQSRDLQYKKYGVRYSGRSPNVESGTTSFIDLKISSIGKNNLLFFVDSFYDNIRGDKVRKITLPYLDAILKPNKVYFLKINCNYDGKEDIFEEVKYQKYITDA